MSTSIIKTGVLLAVVVAMAHPSLAAQAPKEKSERRGMTYASIAKQPDWTGVWAQRTDAEDRPLDTVRPAFREPKNPPPLNAEYQAQFDKFKADVQSGKINPDAAAGIGCLPNGMPGVMRRDLPMEFLFTPGRLTIHIERELVRSVFLDGRPHGDPDPTFNGHSIGHWEGDVLVIDTVGILADTAIGAGLHHSDKMHVVERLKLLDKDHLDYDQTVEDPGAFTKAWKTHVVLLRRPTWEVMEFVCEQNNKESVDANGNVSLDLGFKPGN